MERRHQKSEECFAEAKRYIPGGVNSPVRAFRAVGRNPLFIDYALGSKVVDVDGHEYIDYVGSYGPLILGHRHPNVVEALSQCLEAGTGFGAPTQRETTLARMVAEAFPSLELVRMVNSGTEAVMSALRLARAFTGRRKILKFEGCYHGHADSLLVKAGSGALTLGVPSSPGVTADTAQNTLTASYNDLAGVKEILARKGQDIAAIILEPVAGNMGVVNPEPGFLQGLRELTKHYGIVLIFDEVMTGFRGTYGGVQDLAGVTPDLTCLGKVIGGGLPVGAYGGRRDLMSLVAPAGPVYQAGTLSGNPLAMSAGIATLRVLQQPGVYEELLARAERLACGLEEEAGKAGVKIRINRFGSMLCLFFSEKPVKDYRTAVASDVQQFKTFFHIMLEEGIYLPPSQFEAIFVSLAHSDEDIERTIAAAGKAFAALGRQ